MKLSIFLKNNLLLIVISLASILYVITAYNSIGFHHADEHYQIIEFARLKLGINTPSDLPWEFKAQIRPTLQPLICFYFFEAFEMLEINDPYSQAFLLRVFSALFAIITISFFVKSTRNFFKNDTLRLVYYLLSFFLWFIPFISVRFSSETWAGLLFLLALAVFGNHSKRKTKALIIGFILGLSFLFRFQMGFAILGFGLWLLIIKRPGLNYFLKMGLGFLSIIILGAAIDFWFYGELVFTPWNYFYVNIIDGAASGFGTSPWYFYLINLFKAPSYFIGIPIFISFVMLLISDRKSYLVWIVLSFFICHSIVLHKEIRFLFPIVFLFPLILMRSYVQLLETISRSFYQKIFKYSLTLIFTIVNVLGLIAMAQKPAGIGRMEITSYIHNNFKTENINLIFSSWANPYDPWHSLPLKFYEEKYLTSSGINSLCELNDSLLQVDAVNLLVIRKMNKANAKCFKELLESRFTFKMQSVPEWIERLNNYYGGFENKSILELYHIEPPD